MIWVFGKISASVICVADVLETFCANSNELLNQEKINASSILARGNETVTRTLLF